MTGDEEIQEFIGLRASQNNDWKARLVAIVLAQKERLFLFSPIFMGAGVAIYFGLRFEPSWLVAGLPVIALLGPLWYLWPHRLNDMRIYVLFLVTAALFLCASGFAFSKLRTQIAATPIISKSIKFAEVEGRVANIETLEEGQGLRLILKDLSIDKLTPENTPYSIRLKVRKADDVKPGDRIAVLAELNPPSAPVAPGAFDFQRFAYFKQIGAFGFSYKNPVVIKRADNSASLWLEHLRQKVGARIAKAMPAREAGIANALMTGERAAISEQDMIELRNSGIVHIISISGLHISMIAGVVFFVVRFFMACFPTFAVYHPIKKYSAVIALIVTILYMFMVGSTVPTVRSVIMTGVMLMAIMLDRIPVSLRLVGIAALMIMVLVPEAVIGASFQMSFMAVMGLVAFYEATRVFWVDLYRRAGWFNRGLMYLAGVCLTTVIASIATAPFSIYHFQQFANYGLLANLLAVPLTSFIIMPASLLAYILMPLGLEGPVLWVMGQGLSGMLWVSHIIANLPHAVWNPPSWPMTALVAFTLAGILICLLQGWGKVVALAPLLAGLSGKLIAVRSTEDQVYVSSLRSDKFVAKAWVRLLGQGMEKPKAFRDSPLSCDEWGCRYEIDGKRVALAFHPGGHVEDCQWADIVVADDPVRMRSCGAKITVDRFDLWREGAYAVWIGEGRALSVADVRGVRPWAVSNSR